MYKKDKRLFSGFRALILLCMLLISATVLIGCAAKDAPPPPVTFGTFLDSPVSGLSYATPSLSGVTDAEGKFMYISGETVSFTLGGLVLGSATGKSTITPLDIVSGATGASDQRVTNMLVLLQTLDADGDLNNGIQITAGITAIVANYATKINFNQTATAFAADANVTALLAALNAGKVFTASDPRARTLRSATAAQDHFARSTSERKIVSTQYGQVSGYAANTTTWQWLGVPYAKPPIGDLRWKSPQEPTSWTGVRQAVAYTPMAAQMLAMEVYGEGGISEDCLHLNITAPKDASNLPVMVWFHGGAFTLLTANSKQYNNATGLSTKGVVLVTVNHRLGPFGYIAHPLLTAESGYNGSGNYGQMDLVLALKWVKNNIANFGGNPNNVTIFGQSGGGGKVFALMMSPQAIGLFHKAIIQSGANAIVQSTPASSLGGMESVGTALFNRSGVTTLAEARALPWTAIIEADTVNNIPREIYRPNWDNYYLTKTYSQNVADGMPSDIPLMVGVTSGDYTTLRAQLPIFMTQRTPTYKSNQYVYRFERVPAGWLALDVTCGHGGELPYLFNYPMGLAANFSLGNVLTSTGARLVIGDLNGNGITGSAGDTEDVYTSMGWDASDEAMVQTTMTIWSNFAKNGNPNITGLTWPAYTTANDTYVQIGPTTTTVTVGVSQIK